MDSLQQHLEQKDIGDYTQVVVRCQLARALFEQHLDQAFQQMDTALNLANKQKDANAKALIYATQVHLLVQKKDIPGAYAALDSALRYEPRVTDPVAKGMVWLRNGWLDLVANENDLSVAKLLKAADFFKKGHNHEYMTLAYHYLASIYSYGADVQRQKDYALYSLNYARSSKNVDALNTAYYTVGQYFYDQYKISKNPRELLDSALYYYRQSIRLSQRASEWLLVRSNTAAVALNTANIYFQHYPAHYRDSVYHYLEIAEQMASTTGLTEILVNCYGMRSEYALQQGDTKGAEQLLLTALDRVNHAVVNLPLAKARIYQNLARIAEVRRDPATALQYLKNYVSNNQEAFNQERITNAQRLEARYRSVEQKQQIALLAQEANFRKKRQTWYVVLGLTGLLSLAFMLVSYNYKLKASLRKQELIDKAKQEAELQVKLQETEANRLLAEQALLRERQERLEKELLAEQLRKEEKNQLLELLTQKDPKGDALLNNQQLKRMVKQQQKLDRDYDGYKNDFLEVNPIFFERLQQRAGDTLTRLDLKYCSYILMGLPNKEISTRLGIEPKSIRMARYRIKQKLKLDKEAKLDDFILSLAVNNPT
ncbi:LuxR C-terminal-related transcriptional regulator [Olivibacter ginsenosidimutans]|uniref:LuxR C-terminal-related transcriptional regulator n=2 Tax=Olivibacter ginsenosidimutans TaxID=1176537 RepID=A0ABP9CB73_9SPHI